MEAVAVGPAHPRSIMCGRKTPHAREDSLALREMLSDYWYA